MAQRFHHSLALRRADLACALLLIGCLTAYTLVFPVVSYDSFAYHLPFSSYLLDIGGGKNSFRLCGEITNRYRGFPKLFEFLQGAFWKITGSFHSVIVPQMAVLCGFVYSGQRRLAISPTLTLVALCMCPLLVIHAAGTNNDLFPGILIAWGLIVLVDILTAPERVKTSSWLLLITLFATASATKFQATLVTSAVLVAIVMTLAARRQLKLSHFCWLLVAGIAVNAWEIRNLVEHGNPFYPIGVNIMGHVLFAGPESAYSLRPQYGPDIGAFYFLTSLTEFDWVKRGVVAFYSLAMESGDSARNFGAARTGGFGQPYVIASLSLIAAQFVFWRILDQKQKTIIWMSVGILIITSLMPQANELRYWLYLPLFWNVGTLRFLGLTGAGFRGALVVAIPFAAIGAASSMGYVWDSRYTVLETPARYINPGKDVKVVQYPILTDFRFSQAMTGQNVVLFCN